MIVETAAGRRASAVTAVLLVAQDPELCARLGEAFNSPGVSLVRAADAGVAETLLSQAPFDVAVLDAAALAGDGLELCRRLVELRGPPTILLARTGDFADRLVGLEVGADECLARDSHPREILARLRALVRRSALARESCAGEGRIYLFAGWRFRPSLGELCTPAGAQVTLTPAELELMRAFVERPGQTLTRPVLCELLRSRAEGPKLRVIDTQVARLRRKLREAGGGAGLIRTMRGGGYAFTAEVRRV